MKFKDLFPVKFKTYLKKFKTYNAYHDLDKKLLKYINYKNGFYIDCGANNGVDYSTTWYFEKYLRWRGILIEPIPEIYNQLKKNRNNNNYFYNCALVNSHYNQEEIKLYFNKEDSLRLQAKKIDNNLKKDSKIITVKCKTLQKVLDDIEIPKLIDLFSLDVEGSEFEVLQGINFNSVKFKYILIETESPEKINNFLTTKNYHLIERLSNYNFLEKPNFGDYLYKTY